MGFGHISKGDFLCKEYFFKFDQTTTCQMKKAVRWFYPILENLQNFIPWFIIYRTLFLGKACEVWRKLV